MFNYTNNSEQRRDMKQGLKCWQYHHRLNDTRCNDIYNYINNLYNCESLPDRVSVDSDEGMPGTRSNCKWSVESPCCSYVLGLAEAADTERLSSDVEGVGSGQARVEADEDNDDDIACWSDVQGTGCNRLKFVVITLI